MIRLWLPINLAVFAVFSQSYLKHKLMTTRLRKYSGKNGVLERGWSFYRWGHCAQGSNSSWRSLLDSAWLPISRVWNVGAEVWSYHWIWANSSPTQKWTCPSEPGHRGPLQPRASRGTYILDPYLTNRDVTTCEREKFFLGSEVKKTFVKQE